MTGVMIAGVVRGELKEGRGWLLLPSLDTICTMERMKTCDICIMYAHQ